MDNFINITYLSTLAGVVVVVNVLTQFTKELVDKYLAKVPTKYVTFVYALLTMLIYQLVTSTFEFKLIYVTFINAVIVTLTAQGGYEWIFKKLEQNSTPTAPKEIDPTNITNDMK